MFKSTNLFRTAAAAVKAAAVAAVLASGVSGANAQERSPLIDPNDTVFLMVDHQSGLFQTVHDIPVRDLRVNVSALAKVATLLDIPVIASASVPGGPNGPLMPEIGQYAPKFTYVERNGEINAWDAAAFKSAVEATGRKTLVISGVWTSVCVLFPALSALGEGYTVYAVLDASGDVSDYSSRTTMTRLSAAGAHVTSTNSIIAELQRTWNREDAAKFGAVYADIAPNYAAAMESFYATPAAK